MLDVAGCSITGYGAIDCEVIIGDEIARTVRWRGCADLAKIAGSAVQLRFSLKDAELYSFRFEQ